MEKKIPDIQKMMSETCIARFYQNRGWSCKVYPVFNIDKVKFSFFSTSKDASMEPFDIYVDIDDFSGLCDSIKNLLLFNSIARDQGQYPSAWTHQTGSNGQKAIAIGKGQKGGIVLQGRIKSGEKTPNAFVSIENYQLLLSMAYFYDLVSGRSEAFGYYKTLYDIFWEGMKTIAKHHSSYDESVDQKTWPTESDENEENADNADSPENVTKATAKKDAAPQKRPAGSSEKAHVNSSKGTANKPQNKPTEPSKEPLNTSESNTPVKPPAGKISAKVYHGRFNTTTKLFGDGKGLYYVGIEPVSENLRDGHERYLIFPRESMKNIPKDQFDRLQRGTKGKSIILSVNYFNGKNEKQLFFHSFNND